MGGTNRNISVRAVGDFSNLSQGLQQAQSQIQSFGDRVKEKFKEIGEIGRGIKDVLEVFKEVGEGVGELANRAAELDGGMSSLNRTLGQSAVSYMAWANSTAGSFGISKMSAIEYGKSIAMLLADVYKNQGQLAAATEKLMQGGAVIAAKTGKSQQEVYEELNSALMGHAAAVKSLDINIMENALVHSQAYKQIANGTPWVKLSAEQQQYIRVTELNRQIQQKFGDTIGNGMDARLMLFKKSLDDLQTALAEAFMPILYKVLPLLTTFMTWIQTAISYVAAFFQVLFGYSGIQAGATGALNQHAQAVNALGDAYANAGNKAGAAHKAISGGTPHNAGIGGAKNGRNTLNHNGTASFDQVHTLTKNSNATSAGGSGGAGSAGGAIDPTGGLGDISNGLNDVGNNAKALADNLEKFREQVAGFANAVKGFFESIGNFIKQHKDLIIAILAGLGAALLVVFGPAIFGAILEGVLGLLSGLVAGFAALLSPLALVAIAVGVLVAGFVYLYETNKTFANNVNAIWDGIKKAFGEVGQAIQDLMKGDWQGALDHMQQAWQDIVKPIENAWNDLWNWLKGVWGIIAKWWHDNVTQPVVDKWTQLKTDMGNKANEIWDAIKRPFVDAYNWFRSNVATPVSNAFNGLENIGRNIWRWVTTGFGNVRSWFTSYVANPIDSAFNGLRYIGSNIWSWITRGLGGIGSWFYWNVSNPIHSAFSQITSGLGGAIESGFKTIYNKAADFLNKIINAFNSIKNNLPFGLGGYIPSVPNIPHLANGGITNGPMLAMIGDNPGGQEVVSPLDKLQSMIGNTILQTVQAVQGNNNGSSVGGDIILNIDGKTFARIIKPHLDKEVKRVGTNIRLKSI